MARRFSHLFREGHPLDVRRAARLGPWVALATILASVTPARAQDATTAFAYEVAIEVIDAPNIAEIFKRSSLLLELAKRPPSSERGLRRRIEDDRDRLTRILRSEGYYAAEITTRTTGEAPVKIEIEADPGPVYRLGEFDLVVKDCEGRDCAPRPDQADLGLSLGQRARAAELVAARAAARRWYEARGHPVVEVGELEATVDHDNRGVFIELPLVPGHRRLFGPPRFTGGEGVQNRYLARLQTWSPGEPYDRRKLDDFARRLRETGLFSTVTVAPLKDEASSGPVPIDVTLGPAKRRSVGAGVAYSTSEGPSGRVFWENRNLLGGDEDLRVTGTGSFLRQALEIGLRKPAFPRFDHSLAANLVLQHEDRDAFNQRSLGGDVAVERRATPQITTSIGVLGEAAEISDQEGETISLIAGIPVSLVRDARNDPLDPRRGYRYAFQVTPFAGAHRGPVAFARLEASGSYYHEVLEDGRLVLALRGHLGVLPGPETEDIPATRRFYAGGGGSIRGYAFEAVGPLDAERDPLGGRSLVEMSAEARARSIGDFGLALFIDGGNVYDDLYPGLNRSIRWAAGIGGRYFTAVGPLRVDFAVPVNPRRDDDAFQFYISLGQAF